MVMQHPCLVGLRRSLVRSRPRSKMAVVRNNVCSRGSLRERSAPVASGAAAFASHRSRTSSAGIQLTSSTRPSVTRVPLVRVLPLTAGVG